MTYVCHRNGLNECRDEIDHDDKTHRETTETAQLVQEHKFAKVVYRRVNPTPTLRQQDLPIVWSDRVGMGVTNELCLEVGEVLQQKGRKISIFSKMQQVLHVQGVHTILRVILDQLVRDE